MKKRISIKWIILIVVLALVVAFAIKLLFAFPFYDGFQKTADSYEELQSKLKSVPVFLPDLSGFTLQNAEYRVLMDGRDIRANKIGYEVTGDLPKSIVEDGSGILSLRCTTEKSGIYRNLPDTYREIPIIIRDDITASSDQYICWEFALGKYEYSFSTYYSIDGIDEETNAALYETCSQHLQALTEQVIDQYWDTQK